MIREVLRAAFPPGKSTEDPSSRLVGIYGGDEDESRIVDEALYRR